MNNNFKLGQSTDLLLLSQLNPRIFVSKFSCEFFTITCDILGQIAELEECLIELTKYMSRGDEFEVPGNTTELCSAAKQYIVSNHAVTISELDSKHMLELDECKVVS